MKSRIKASRAIDDYDYLSDSFMIRPSKRNYAYSRDFKDLILDFGVDGNLVGIEVLGASKFFGISKANIRNLKSLRVEIESSEKELFIRFELKYSVHNKELQKDLDIRQARPEFLAPDISFAAVS